MNRNDWVQLLISIFTSLLAEYARRTSQDEAQDAISRVGFNVMNHGNAPPQPVKLSHLTSLFSSDYPPHHPPIQNDSVALAVGEVRQLSEKEAFRVLNGTA